MQVVYPQESTESTKRGVLANGNGVSTAVYAVVNQELGTSQGLVAAKARLAKRSTTIPRLELISAYMATNLICNVLICIAGWIAVCRCIGSKTTVNTSSSWPIEFTRSKLTKRLLGTMSQQQKILQISEAEVEA